MIPGNPCQLPAIRAQARRGVKILSRQQHARFVLTFQVDGDNGVYRLVAGTMVFADTNNTMTLAINHGIGIAPVFTRGNRVW